MAYRFTDHTADYGVEVSAFTAEEAFCDAVRAMYEILFGQGAADLFRTGNRGTPEPIHLAEPSTTDLLHTWIATHLDAYYQRQLVASGWRIRADTRKGRIDGEIYFQNADNLNLKLETEIKGVTYHDLRAISTLERTQLHYIVDV